MADLSEFFSRAVTTLFGLAFVGGLLTFVYKRHAEDWQKLAAVYGRSWSTPTAQKRFQNLILYREGVIAKPYNSMVHIGLYTDGIGLRMFPLFAPFHAPIFVPYREIKGWQQTWYLNAKSIELAFDKLPDMRLIMPADQVEWIHGASLGAFPVSEQKPSHNHWPAASHSMAIACGVVAVLFVAYLAMPAFR